MHSKSKYTHYKTRSQTPRILSVVVSKADFLKKKRPIRELVKEESEWANVFMESHFDKRLNPTLLVEDAKSVVSLLLNYYPEQKNK
jgi:epoxyqueuosine reductase